MTRKKVKLALIANDSERKASFKKRKKGFLKKVSELSTLCGVDACAIIFSPFDGNPEVWPSPLGVQRVLAKFRRMPDMEQNRKMVNQESFTRNRIKKSEEQLKKQRRENRRKEVEHVINQCLGGARYQNFNVMDLNDMGFILNQNLRELNMRIESLKRDNATRQGLNKTTTSGRHVGESSKQAANIATAVAATNAISATAAAEIANPQSDEFQNFQWNMDVPTPNVQPGGIGMVWDDAFSPFPFNNDAPGPSFSDPDQLDQN